MGLMSRTKVPASTAAPFGIRAERRAKRLPFHTILSNAHATRMDDMSFVIRPVAGRVVMAGKRRPKRALDGQEATFVATVARPSPNPVGIHTLKMGKTGACAVLPCLDGALRAPEGAGRCPWWRLPPGLNGPPVPVPGGRNDLATETPTPDHTEPEQRTGQEAKAGRLRNSYGCGFRHGLNSNIAGERAGPRRSQQRRHVLTAAVFNQVLRAGRHSPKVERAVEIRLPGGRHILFWEPSEAPGPQRVG
jgi:hypothetical protein